MVNVCIYTIHTDPMGNMDQIIWYLCVLNHPHLQPKPLSDTASWEHLHPFELWKAVSQCKHSLFILKIVFAWPELLQLHVKMVKSFQVTNVHRWRCSKSIILCLGIQRGVAHGVAHGSAFTGSTLHPGCQSRDSIHSKYSPIFLSQMEVSSSPWGYHKNAGWVFWCFLWGNMLQTKKMSLGVASFLILFGSWNRDSLKSSSIFMGCCFLWTMQRFWEIPIFRAGNLQLTPKDLPSFPRSSRLPMFQAAPLMR